MNIKDGSELTFFLTGSDGSLMGKMSYIRLPRKQKKRKKKDGSFKPKEIVGLPLKTLNFWL